MACDILNAVFGHLSDTAFRNTSTQEVYHSVRAVDGYQSLLVNLQNMSRKLQVLPFSQANLTLHFLFFKVVSGKNSSKYLKINEQMVLLLAVLCVLSVVSRVLICICGCLNCKKLHLKIKVSI